MRNPYENIEWNNVIEIPSLSHAHCTKERPDRFLMYYSGGIRHFGISNYYPSEPYYPLDDYFTEITIPEDAISCPNAEHHGLLLNGIWNSKLHINGLVSFFSSNPSSSQRGIDNTWQYCVDRILENLQFSDGGGATINHPVWTGLNSKQICDILDYDKRVLGMEIYSGDGTESTLGYCLELWDEVLLTGRRCYGFCVPDHDVETQEENFRGRNILLCSEATEYDCAKAYRNGHFYGAKINSDLKFNSILFTNNTLSVETSNADNIVVVIDGNKTIINGSNCEIDIPKKSIYVRVEAYTIDNVIYSQPIMLVDKVINKHKNIMMWY